MKLFTPYKMGSITLANRMVMAPMTRSRAYNNIPNSMMAQYYALRGNAGLIITEGTSPSPNGLGYPRIPGIYSDEQVHGWKEVTSAVHSMGGRIFIQLMHTGRVAHPYNMPADSEILAPSAIAPEGKIYTDKTGSQPYPTPRPMTMEDIRMAREEFVKAAVNAIRAGFDGVEIHAANGYLIDQFINPASNKRTDIYGGDYRNRSRFVLEVARDVSMAIGTEKTGIRLSPYGVFNDMERFEKTEESFVYLATELGNLDLAYLHLVDHSDLGAPDVPDSIKSGMRKSFKGTFIISGGYDRDSAEEALKSGEGDLVSIGREFIANPDLVYRYKNDIELNEPDSSTFYSPGMEGYLDYPIENKELKGMAEKAVTAAS